MTIEYAMRGGSLDGIQQLELGIRYWRDSKGNTWYSVAVRYDCRRDFPLCGSSLIPAGGGIKGVDKTDVAIFQDYSSRAIRDLKAHYIIPREDSATNLEELCIAHGIKLEQRTLVVQRKRDL